MCIARVAALIIYVSLSGKENPRAESPVRISEIMYSNKGSVPDGNGEYYDWIELYNTSSEAVEISGCGSGRKMGMRHGHRQYLSQ